MPNYAHLSRNTYISHAILIFRFYISLLLWDLL